MSYTVTNFNNWVTLCEIALCESCTRGKLRECDGEYYNQNSSHQALLRKMGFFFSIKKVPHLSVQA